jgi:O-antigen ligase
MLQLIYAYVAGLGPYVAAALALGIGIPFLLLVTKPERWLVAFMVLFMGLAPFGGGGGVADVAEGSIYRQTGWGLIFLLALYYALRDEQGRFFVPWNWLPWPYLVLLAYAVVSVSWAEQSIVSAKRVVQLFGVLLVALALVRQRGERDALERFTWPAVIFLALGALALAVPSLSFDPDGNYKGTAITKNTWGQFALFAALIFLYQALSKYRTKLNWWLFGGAFLSLAATRSATSIAIIVAAVSIMLAWFAHRRYRSNFQIALLGFALVSVAMAFGYFMFTGTFPVEAALNAGLGSVGKDATLTGRSELWRMMGYEIARHPWLGAGFGGFWMGLEGPSFTIVRMFSWRPGQAHNGYIDVVNDLGYVGLALLLIVLLIHLRNLYLFARGGEELRAVFHLAILSSMILLNASETSFLRTTHLWWIVLTLSIVEIQSRLKNMHRVNNGLRKQN